ncbi:hypothetical protein Tco_0605154, partial [Tanacetum coccineum]
MATVAVEAVESGGGFKVGCKDVEVVEVRHGGDGRGGVKVATVVA